MKILHVCNHFYPCKGGIERVVEDLCIRLRKIGYEVGVACLNTCAYENKKLKSYDVHNGIEIHRLPYLNLKYYKIARGILGTIKGYDIVHVHGLGFLADFLSLTRFIHKKPVIVTPHGAMFHTKRLHLLKRLYFHTLCRVMANLCSMIVVQSRNDEKLLKNICRPILVNYSIDYSKFNVKGKKGGDFLFVGRLSRNKGIDNLIEVFARLNTKARLFIAGGDWEGLRSKIEKRVKELGLGKRVVFLGEISEKELLKQYSKCRFFVSASKYEGFGLTVIEAMAAGCVVILNDIESFRNIVSDGNDGFIVDFSDHSKAAEKIRKIMERKDLEKIGRKAKETARKYDWEKSLDKLINIYKKLLS